MIQRRIPRLFGALLLAVSGLVATAPLSVATTAAECRILDNEGSQIWMDDAAPEVTAAAWSASRLVDSAPDALAGAGFCSNRRAIWISGRHVESTSAALVKSLAAQGVEVVVIETQFSRSSLLEAQAEIMTEMRGKTELSIWIEPALSEVHVSLPYGKTAELDSRSKTGPSVPIAILAEPQQVAKSSSYDRFSDFSPFNSGGYVSPGCSLGPRVRLNGQYMILTAGHCGAQSPYRSGTGMFIGNLYTTSYPGNADIYGDWLLVYGGSYNNDVFTGPPTGSSATLEGASLNLGSRPIGNMMCASGITTGQGCRYAITRDYVYSSRASNDGVVVGPTFELRYDNAGTSNPNDCLYTGRDFTSPAVQEWWMPHGISRQGDSGGANYHAMNSSASPPVEYDGITTGQYVYAYGTQIRCLYYSSQLAGLKSFAPTVSW